LTLPGAEKQAIIHLVRLVYPQQPASQDLNRLRIIVTNYRILVLPDDEDIDSVCLYSIPLMSILDLKSPPSGGPLTMDIKTKDCRFFQFVCEDPGMNKGGFITLLNTLIFSKPSVGSVETKVFALSRPTSTRSRLFTWEKELDRLDNDAYTICTLNHDYSVCSSYPKKFLTPKNVTDDVIMGSSKFRDKGRIPVLCWAPPRRDCKLGSIWRSSQPKSSLLNRSANDEEYLKSIGIMYIIDCRPMLNAYANIANAGGVESLGNYHSGIQLFLRECDH
jgi:hypothetical protein